MKKKLFISIVVLVVAFLTAFAAYQHQHQNVYTCLQDDCEKGCTFFSCNCGFYKRSCGKCGSFLESKMEYDKKHKRYLFYVNCTECPHTSVWAQYIDD